MATDTFCVNWSSHAMRIRSGVAGLSRRKLPWRPASARAAAIASLAAKNTEADRNRGGSPIACKHTTNTNASYVV